MSNAVATSKKTAILYSRSTFMTYLYSIIFVYLTVDWYFFEKSISLFNWLIYTSINNIIFILFLYIVSFCIITLTSFYPTNLGQNVYSTLKNIDNLSLNDKNNSENYNSEMSTSLELRDVFQSERDHYNLIEYSLLTQFIIIGGITLLSSNDLITIFLSIELQSYGLYILSTIYRNSESSTGAGLTYFLLGGLSSCIILLGLSFLYINSGTTGLDGLYVIHNIITSDNDLLSVFYTQNNELFNLSTSNFIFNLNFYQYTLQFSLVILTVGFLFKISAAPFHSWSPGVYDAIPTVTTTFIAIIPKISILIFLFDIVYSTWLTTFNYSWTSILLFSSFLSLVIGSVLGLTQFKIKRLYAYSTISHVGFILLALCIHNVESIQAFFFYIIQYSLSNLNAFLILVLIGYTYVNYKKRTKAYESILSVYNDYKEKINELSPVEYIDNLKGYFYLNPILALSLAVTLYSFIGVPPLVGFFAKQMILSSALDNGDIFMCLIAILTSVVSAVYYLYIVQIMFFEKTKYTLNILLSIDYMNLVNVTQKTSAQLVEGNINEEKNTIDTINLANGLTCLISTLSLIILLFIFLYYEIYYLMNILSVLKSY